MLRIAVLGIWPPDIHNVSRTRKLTRLQPRNLRSMVKLKSFRINFIAGRVSPDTSASNVLDMQRRILPIYVKIN